MPDGRTRTPEMFVLFVTPDNAPLILPVMLPGKTRCTETTRGDILPRRCRKMREGFKWASCLKAHMRVIRRAIPGKVAASGSEWEWKDSPCP
jgi:hypothetical protein